MKGKELLIQQREEGHPDTGPTKPHPETGGDLGHEHIPALLSKLN